MKVEMYVHELCLTTWHALTLYPLCMNKWNEITTLTILAKPLSYEIALQIFIAF